MNFEPEISAIDIDLKDAMGIVPELSPGEYYSGVDGGDGDEDSTDDEGESDEVGGLDDIELPKFRTLVKNKKLELKAQYGKGHFESKKTCVGGWYDKWGDGRPPEWKDDINCVNMPSWVPGWRRQWKKFKQQGGLAQLRMQSKGLTTPSVPGNSNTPKPPNPTKKDNVDKTKGQTRQDVEGKTGDETRSSKISDKSSNDLIWVGIGVVLVGGFFLIKYKDKIFKK